MKKTTVIICTLLFIMPILAHEFWLQPQKFIFKKGEKANIKFLVGEDFTGDNWAGNNSRIKSLIFYNGTTTTDISGSVSSNKGDSIQLSLPNEGTMMVAYNSNNAAIDLTADKFNAYLQEDGLTKATAYRQAHHETDSAGHELYQRSVKTLFQVGQLTNNTVSRETGLPLDIVPLSNPYALHEGDSLTARILFKKQPLANVLINTWHRVNNKTTHNTVYTNALGEIRFPVLLTGVWMISTVKMERLQNNPAAQWQSYWGSCTFGYN